jgi:hypothetical protein
MGLHYRCCHEAIIGETSEGEILLGIPNLAIAGLYVERIQRMLLPEPHTRDQGREAGRRLYAASR